MTENGPDPVPDPTAPQPPTDAVSFAAPAESRGRRTGRALAWVAVGAIGATALTGVAMAASGGSSSPSPSATGPESAPSPDASTAPGMPGMGGPGGGPHGGRGGGLMGELRGALHGEIVVKDGDGTKTLLAQRGAVTAASSTSLTVKSTDGFTATWTLNGSTTVRAFVAKGADAKTSDLKVGDAVLVVGTKASATSGTATTVHVEPTAAQLEELRKNAPQWRGRDGGVPDRKAPTATPSAPSTSSSTA